ncbi:MAG: hypothetical protein M1814_002388 [Vezdaea aestivalis]|nr:MAG: hypothetical protein M1814_002388 [Vezdaea aestivalis]
MSATGQYQLQSSYPQSPTGPPPPPKPNASQGNTPRPGDGQPPLPPPPHSTGPSQHRNTSQGPQNPFQLTQTAPADPGDKWVPSILSDKSIPELSKALSTPSLLSSLSSSPEAQPPSVPLAASFLQPGLTANLALASSLRDQEAQAAKLRSETEAQLLRCHALERSWRDTQSRMDAALGPFAPPALYQVLLQSISEQEAYCKAMEESFLEGDGEAGDREVADWLRSYREGRKKAFLRLERKRRWDEGRVGGWR